MKRDDVMANAKSYIGIQGWSPTNDTVVFTELADKPTFVSAFAKGSADTSAASKGAAAKVAAPTYTVVPYVFGGFDTVTGFVAKMARSDLAPGGWDRVQGKTTGAYFLKKGDIEKVKEGEKQVQKEVKEKRYLAANHLGGIDCSGFASRCWGLTTKLGTTTIPGMTLAIPRSELKAGDALNLVGDHVIVFEKWANAAMSEAWVYESQGGATKRAYKTSDDFGQVVHHKRAWQWFSGQNYVPMSPFPQLDDITPAPATYAGAPAPLIAARCAGSGTMDVTALALDGVPIAFQRKVGYDPKRKRHYVEVRAELDKPFRSGAHEIAVEASNRVASQTFADRLAWSFEIA